ncbi:MAG: hypothetical protein U9N18_06830 [Campylobacterota bacterium]|nr:hypothetical protein [Campylobacterota bacterium]
MRNLDSHIRGNDTGKGNPEAKKRIIATDEHRYTQMGKEFSLTITLGLDGLKHYKDYLLIVFEYYGKLK